MKNLSVWQKDEQKAAHRPPVDEESFVLNLVQDWKAKHPEGHLKYVLEVMGDRVTDFVDDRMPAEKVAQVILQVARSQPSQQQDLQTWLRLLPARYRKEMDLQEFAEANPE